LWARIVTIAAGPIANYFFASVLMFFGFLLGGNQIVDETSMRVNIAPDGPAAQAGIQKGDRILNVNGESIRDWDHLKKIVGAHPGEKIDIEVERGDSRVHLFPTPIAADGDTKGKILVGPYTAWQPVTAGQAAVLSI